MFLIATKHKFIKFVCILYALKRWQINNSKNLLNLHKQIRKNYAINMVKLSAQREVIPSRLTRTERQLQQQRKAEESALSQKRFEDLQARAKDIQEKKLSNIQSIEQYQEVYNEIDPELRQFFTTPQQLRIDRQQEIQQTKTQIQNKIEKEQRALEIEEENFQKSMSEVPDITPSERKEFKQAVRRDFKQATALHGGRLAGYQESLARLEQGENISISNIETFAMKKGNIAYNKEVGQQKQKSQPKLEVETRTIDANYLVGKMSGLTSEGLRIVRSATGGESEVEIFSVKGGEKIQVVREKDTGKIYYTDLEGKKKGERIEITGLSDKELQDQAVADLEARRLERDPFVDVESIETPKGNFSTKINRFIGNVISKVGDLPIPLFSITGAGGGKIPLRDVTKEAGKGAILIAEKTFVGDIKIPVTIGVSGSQFVSIREFTDVTKQRISAKQEELILSQLSRLGIKEEFDPKFEAEYQARFEDKFGEKIIRGDITFEEAQEQFKTSDEAKLVQERYGQVIERRKRGVVTKETWGLMGLSLAGLGVKLVPETYGELAVESALIYTGTTGIKLIDPNVLLATEGAFGIKGLIDVTDPTLAGEKRVIGGIIAGAVGLHFGFKAIKFLKTPTIKTVKIQPPKATLKADSIISREGKIYKITKGGEIKIVDKAIFDTQKISQTGIAGRRTLISTKWREILKLDPLYQGVPTAQQGTTYSFSGLRGDFTYTTLSGREKAFNLLLKSNQAYLTTNLETKLISLKGISASQVNAILRYTAPRVINQILKSGEVLVSGKQAVAQFKYLTEQPVINVDTALGIKTRGAKIIEKIYDIGREITGEFKGDLIITEKIRLTTIGAKLGKTETEFIRKNLVKSGDVQNMFNKIELQVLKGDNIIRSVSEKIPYQTQDIYGAFAERQINPLKRSIKLDTGKTTIIKDSTRRIVNIDIDKAQGISFKGEHVIEPYPIKKTPLSKTFGEEKVIKQIKDIIKTKPQPVTFDYVDDAVNYGDDLVQGATGRTPPSQYAGTGFYERTESLGGFGDLSKIQVNQALRQGFTPTINIKTQIADLIKLDTLPASTTATKLVLGTMTAVKTSQLLKTNLKLGLDFGSGLKTDLKSETQLKTLLKQAQVQKQGQALKSAQLSAFAPSFAPSPLKTTIFKAPIFTLPLIPFYFPTAKSKAKKKVRDKLLQQQLAYLPDFTARALGLDPQVLTESQVLKKIKQVQTGFEIRRGIRLKQNKLLKGIPN